MAKRGLNQRGRQALSLGASDPRQHRNNQALISDGVVGKGLKLDEQGRIQVRLGGALYLDGEGNVQVRVTPPLSVGPGSPVSIRLDASSALLSASTATVAAGSSSATVAPPIGSYATGSFTVPTGQYVVMSRHLKLSGTQRVTLKGNATLRIT